MVNIMLLFGSIRGETVFTRRNSPDEVVNDFPEDFSNVFDNFCCKCRFDREVYKRLCMNSSEDRFRAKLTFLEVLRGAYNKSDLGFMNEKLILSDMIKSFRDQNWKISHLCCYKEIADFPSIECLTNTFNNRTTTDVVKSNKQSGSCGSISLSICNKPELINDKGADNLSFWLIIASCFLLLLTILTYLLLPSLLNVHGKCILCHLIFLLIFFVLQFVEQFYVSPDIFTEFSDRIFSKCWTIGFFMYTASISANLWLLAVNVDLFQTFTRKYIEDKDDASRRFRNYSIVVMTLTILMSLTVLVTELTITEHSLFKPHIGCTRCFFPVTHDYSILIYYYGIIAAILCFNLIMFIWTNYALCVVQSEISRAKDRSLIKQGLERMFLFFKLFCVSGTTWVINLVFWVTKGHEVPAESKDEAVRFFELFNISHGFCYFIVFVCKPSIIMMYHQKIFAKDKISSNTATTNLSKSSLMKIRI